MAHCNKFVRAASGGMFIHYDRSKDHKLSNQDIDKSRTHLNYNLAAADQPLNQSVFLKKRLSTVKTNGRRTQNVMCDWVVTLPVEIKQGDEKKFFEETYQFLQKKYGKENVISAYVHNDETTPHMHFAFVPIEKTPQGDKLNAKAIINRNTLKSFHGEFSKAMIEKLGYECGIVNGATLEQGGNKTVKELKQDNTVNLKAVECYVSSIQAISEDLAKISLPEPTTTVKRSLLGSKRRITISEEEWHRVKVLQNEFERDNKALRSALENARQAYIQEHNLLVEFTNTPLAKQKKDLVKELTEVKEELSLYQQFIDFFHLEKLLEKFLELIHKFTHSKSAVDKSLTEAEMYQLKKTDGMIPKSELDTAKKELAIKNKQIKNLSDVLRENNWSEKEISQVANQTLKNKDSMEIEH